MIQNTIEKIYRSGLKFLVRLSPEETYTTIVNQAIKLVDGDYGVLTLEENGVFKEVFGTLPIKVKRRKKGFTYQAFKEAKVLQIDVDSAKPNSIHSEHRKIGIKSIILIPISYRTKSIGVLSLHSKKEQFLTKEDLKGLQVFGTLASLAIRKSQLYYESQKAIESRDLFISLAAHELRTPLTTIHGYAELLYRKTANGGADAGWIRELYAESNRMVVLVNDLLEINRIRTGKVQYIWRECSLKELLKRAINNFEINYPERHFVFNNNLGRKTDLAICDFDKLLQVVINLLENAVKFSAVNKEIILTLDFKSPYFILRVEDHGKGIDKKDLPKVFDGYYKGGHSSTQGMGLGLFLAKNIINHHHGSINIHSKINKGTKVEIRLSKIKV